MHCSKTLEVWLAFVYLSLFSLLKFSEFESLQYLH